MVLVQEFHNPTHHARREIWVRGGVLHARVCATTYLSMVGTLEVPHAHAWSEETYIVQNGQIVVGVLTGGAVHWVTLKSSSRPLVIPPGVFHSAYHMLPSMILVEKAGIPPTPPRTREEILECYLSDKVCGRHHAKHFNYTNCP